MTTTPPPSGPDGLSSETQSESECENCGATGVGTEPVRRVYLDVAAPGDPDAATVTDDVERWCASCQANYPHQVQSQPG